MTTNYREKIQRGENPFVAYHADEDDEDFTPLYELKFGLVFFVDYPPGPKRARKVFDLYMERYSHKIKRYISTAPGMLLEDWSLKSMELFRNDFIPNLRKASHWGYGFDDGNSLDTYLFMFHGYRPVTEKGRASFFRFEFPWNVDQNEVKEFAISVASCVPFLSGFSGYFFKPAVHEPESYDKMYAVCRRFWGIDAWNLDMIVHYMLNGYSSINWLTFIGNALIESIPDSAKTLQEAKDVSLQSSTTKYGTVLQSTKNALLGDRNLQDDMSGYIAIAQALLPLQIKEFGSFGGERWDEDNSFNWLRRFTHPENV
jgi:hypothetical protein